MKSILAIAVALLGSLSGNAYGNTQPTFFRGDQAEQEYKNIAGQGAKLVPTKECYSSSAKQKISADGLEKEVCTASFNTCAKSAPVVIYECTTSPAKMAIPSEPLQPVLSTKTFACGSNYLVLYVTAGSDSAHLVSPSSPVTFVYDLNKKIPGVATLEKAATSASEQANVDELFNCSDVQKSQGCHFLVKTIFGGAPDFPLSLSLQPFNSADISCVQTASK